MSPENVTGELVIAKVLDVTPTLVTVPPADPEIPTLVALVTRPLESTVILATEEELP
jgi:hypothetical protein